jgi:hypothetical protein
MTNQEIHATLERIFRPRTSKEDEAERKRYYQVTHILYNTILATGPWDTSCVTYPPVPVSLGPLHGRQPRRERYRPPSRSRAPVRVLGAAALSGGTNLSGLS